MSRIVTSKFQVFRHPARTNLARPISGHWGALSTLTLQLPQLLFQATVLRQFLALFSLS
jgi:hypothetical protein